MESQGVPLPKDRGLRRRRMEGEWYGQPEHPIDMKEANPIFKEGAARNMSGTEVFRRIALPFPAVEEGSHMGHADFRFRAVAVSGGLPRGNRVIAGSIPGNCESIAGRCVVMRDAGPMCVARGAASRP
jgi:hypothetical protein